jgi:hypothetical protein
LAKKKAAGANALAIVLEDCKVYYEGHLINLEEGQGIEDPAFAKFLYETGAPVEYKGAVDNGSPSGP